MITSLTNEKIKNFAKLLEKKNRDKQGLFLVEGFHIVEEARDAKLLVEVLTSNPSIEGTLVSKDIIKKLSTTETPQEIVGVVKKPEPMKLGDKVLVLDNVQDPGNVGTLIRTATSFGWDSVVVKGADIFSSKTIRASQGSLFKINVLQTQDILLHAEGYELIGALLDKDAEIYSALKPAKKFMLILGNEGNGISETVIKKLHKKVYIPIEFESLNVAVAGGILLNEYK